MIPANITIKPMHNRRTLAMLAGLNQVAASFVAFVIAVQL